MDRFFSFSVHLTVNGISTEAGLGLNLFHEPLKQNNVCIYHPSPKYDMLLWKERSGALHWQKAWWERKCRDSTRVFWEVLGKTLHITQESSLTLGRLLEQFSFNCPGLSSLSEERAQPPPKEWRKALAADRDWGNKNTSICPLPTDALPEVTREKERCKNTQTGLPRCLNI